MNPTAKLATALMLGIAAGIFPTPLPSFLIILGLAVVATAAGMIGPFAKTMLGFGIPITIMLVIIQGFYGASNVTPLLNLGFATLYKEGLVYALNTVTTLLVFSWKPLDCEHDDLHGGTRCGFDRARALSKSGLSGACEPERRSSNAATYGDD
jgi:hypothetical protein